MIRAGSPADRALSARKGFLADIPVPLEKIARREAIKVDLVPLDDDLSGMSFIKEQKSFIILNSSHHPNRRRFTLAHEIGHHLLHKDYLTDNVHVDKVVLHRDAKSSEGFDRKEVEANQFAAELLMPEAYLRKIRAIDLNDEWFLLDLAKKLKVSSTALTYRIMNLA